MDYKVQTLLFLSVVFACSRVSLPILGEIPSFELIDSFGKQFTEDNISEKIWVADLIFTTCAGPCPIMSSEMKSVQRKVTGYGRTPIARATGIRRPKSSKDRSMKREVPMMFSIVIEPRKRPARTKKTRSLRACSSEASIGCRVLTEGVMSSLLDYRITSTNFWTRFPSYVSPIKRLPSESTARLCAP